MKAKEIKDYANHEKSMLIMNWICDNVNIIPRDERLKIASDIEKVYLKYEYLIHQYSGDAPTCGTCKNYKRK